MSMKSSILGRSTAGLGLVAGVLLFGPALGASPQGTKPNHGGAVENVCIVLGLPRDCRFGPNPRNPDEEVVDCERYLDGRHESQVPPNCQEVAGQLNQVRRATAAFFSYDVAVMSGWDTPISPCVESPAGGMGFHYANIDQLANGGKLSLLRPEALLYAPTADGSMEFLGVEYIIPAPDWSDSEPPELLGQSFHFNPGPNIWALHVWIGRDNPDGIFANFNPDVSCQYAPPPPAP